MHYTKISDEFREEFFKLTNQAQKICITSHLSPDEDAIASMLASYRLLTDKYPEKEIKMIYTSDPLNRYQSFRDFDNINFVSDLADHIGGLDLILMLDGSQYHRFTARPDALEIFQGKKICIDHHSSPIDKFDLSLIVPGASSTTELIYLAFCENQEIDKSLAETFLLGILGDTGNFSYLSPHQTATFLTAKKLVEMGQIEIAQLLARYRTIEPRVLDILQELIKNTEYHRIGDWPAFQSSFLDRQFIEKNGLSDKEVNEASAVYVAHYVRAVTSYSWGFALYPKSDGLCQVSFRSLPGSVNVREVAEGMGIGGGHDRAAGGSFKENGKSLDAPECLNKILEWLSQNKPVLS